MNFNIEPKIFGWLLTIAPRLQADTRLNGHGVLLDQECRVLCSVLVNHIAAHLQSFGFGYGILERYPTSQLMAEFADRTDRLRKVDEAKLRRDRMAHGRELQSLANTIASSLRNEVARIFRIFQGQATVEDILVRAPAASAYYISRLIAAWSGLTPAQKFLLIDGERSLQTIHGGEIPPKTLIPAISNLCLRGTLAYCDTSADGRNLGVKITKSQLSTARRFAANIRDPLDLMPPCRPNKPIPVVFPGLQHVVSGRGRSSGSRKGSFKTNPGPELP
jgi:hypothetical protein